MAIYYMDYDSGNDSTTATPLGWWSVAYTAGVATGTPPADTSVVGLTSGGSAKLTISGSPTTGSWLGGNAAGTLYFYGKTGTYQSENISIGTIGTATISGDFTYCAWKTITSGATAARIAPGDTIRIAKSGTPASLGVDAVWTYKSSVITLGSALTQNVDMCETAWTAATGGDGTVTRIACSTTAGREGSYCMRIALDASPQTSKLQAYYATGSLDLSAYQQLSLWCYGSANIVEGNYNICLCSDTAGSAIVDTFPIPAMLRSYNYPVTVSRTNGGNLGSAIQSIALYTGTVAPTASSYIQLDDIIACKTNSLNLQSFISPSSVDQIGTSEAWYALRSINGTTVVLDTSPSTFVIGSTVYNGYGGSSGTKAVYHRDTVQTAQGTASDAAIQTIQDSGTPGSPIAYEGGFDPSTNYQDGETIFDGLNGTGVGLYINTTYFNSCNYIGLTRYYNGIFLNVIYALGGSVDYPPLFYNITRLCNCSNAGLITSEVRHLNLGTVHWVNNNANNGLYLSTCNFCNISIKHIISCSTGLYTYISKNVEIHDMDMHANNIGMYHYYADDSRVYLPVTMDNVIPFYSRYANSLYIESPSIVESTPITFWRVSGDRAYIVKDDGAEYNDWIYEAYATWNRQPVTRAGASGYEWKGIITNVTRGYAVPLKISIARVAVISGKTVTVTAYITKSHATNIDAALFIDDSQIGGPSVETRTPAADTTTAQNLSINWVPSANGVVNVEAMVWARNSTGYILVDTVTVTQEA